MGKKATSKITRRKKQKKTKKEDFTPMIEFLKEWLAQRATNSIRIANNDTREKWELSCINNATPSKKVLFSAIARKER